MYTSSKRQHVNAFASRLSGVVSETLLRDQICKDQGLSNRSINNGGALRALNAYLSIVPSFSDGGPGLPIVADGFLSSGTCTGPANIRKKVSGAFGVATRNDAAVASSIL